MIEEEKSMLQSFIKYLLKNQVIFALFLIVFFWFVIQIRAILISIFLSYIIMAALLPLVHYLRKNKFPKLFAVLIPYIGIVIAIFLIVVPLVPFMVSQVQTLIIKFPQLLNHSAKSVGFTVDPRQLSQYLNNQVSTISQSAVEVTTKFFGGLFSVLTIFVVSFYLLLYNDDFKKFLANLFQADSREYTLKTLDHINEKLGAWLHGQLILSLIIGFFSWIGLIILGLPYALPLAFIAGLLEALPTLGPIISAVPAVIVALTISPTMALTVIFLY